MKINRKLPIQEHRNQFVDSFYIFSKWLTLFVKKIFSKNISYLTYLKLFFSCKIFAEETRENYQLNFATFYFCFTGVVLLFTYFTRPDSCYVINFWYNPEVYIQENIYSAFLQFNFFYSVCASAWVDSYTHCSSSNIYN